MLLGLTLLLLLLALIFFHQTILIYLRNFGYIRISNQQQKSGCFDDLIIQNKINHYTDGRHHGISLIYLSQFYYDVPQKLRLNCSHMLLYVSQKLR